MEVRKRSGDIGSFIAIDLKSFYASVECQSRNLDPLKTNLVVADRSRTDKTICLAVSPSLKKFGIPGRARLFEVEQRVKEVNAARLRRAPGHVFTGESSNEDELMSDPSLKLSFIAAVPRMAKYIEVSTEIYKIYLKYVAPEDIHVYSIDEVFMDVSAYLSTYKMTSKELAMTMIKDIMKETGITGTAGIGTNMYLCKVAMDIVAKHIPADENGVRIAELDEMSYREKLWDHTPITDFWRVGGGYARRLASMGLYTMGDIARCSLGGDMEFMNEDLLYKAFGINAELLIDHAWGYEPCTMKMIKDYRPENTSQSQGQVLMEPYTFEKARTIVKEMADALSLSLMENGLLTNMVVLSIGYDRTSLMDEEVRKKYRGPVSTDYYGRMTPKHAHGSQGLMDYTFSSDEIIQAALEIYDREVNESLLVRRIYIVAGNTITLKEDEERREEGTFEQLSLFENYEEREEKRKEREIQREKQIALQKAEMEIKKRYGKNAILKGTSFEEGATARDRNNQIGGHKA